MIKKVASGYCKIKLKNIKLKKLKKKKKISMKVKGTKMKRHSLLMIRFINIGVA